MAAENRDIRLDINNLLAGRVGRHGLAAEQLEEIAPAVKRYAQELESERRAGKLPFYDLPYSEEDLRAVRAVWEPRRGRVSDFVILGIGGSALGPRALHAALNHPHFNLLSPDQRRHCPRLWVLDNIDPWRVKALLEVIDLDRAVFNVITKSGSTAETMAQFLFFYELLRARLGGEAPRRLIATTDPEKGPLRQLVREEGFDSLAIPPGVGGRFSVLTAVGLLPAEAVGIDAGRLLAGAARMDERCRSHELWENPAHLNAACLYLFAKAGKNIHVMMPYADGLYLLADWYRQLWAESLGKRVNLKGEVVHAGQTPVKALGVTDQHSQVQLYVEGPFDKVFTLIAVEKQGASVSVPWPLEGEKRAGLDYLAGHTLEELFAAERRGTTIALTEAGRPNETILVPEVCPETLGQLFYLLEVQTAMAGKLYGINAFDQPGVEAGKIAAYALMGRQGYEKRRQELETQPPPEARYIL